MYFINALSLFAVFLATLLLAEGTMQWVYSIIAVVGIFVNGILGVANGDEL